MRIGAALGAALVALAGCGAGDDEPAPAPELARAPYIGVSCPKANSIRCDRVGLAIWLKRNPERLNASIEGRSVKLRIGNRRHDHWEGFLQPAGLIDGPLEVRPDKGRYHWIGDPPVYARVEISAGGRARIVRVRVSPGWG
jgi:hypothetical protein